MVDSFPVFTQQSDLNALNLSTSPTWVFDVSEYRIWWANSEGLRFWGAESLEALRARDFSRDSPTVRNRLNKIVANSVPG
ncbi:MAG: hypothetical protein P1V34_05695, partial [Alphaproteobacteria bacterium]|nr:hypothetical protein [Alphaproteobacteria bacterium]